ncbi:MAG TPA: hypothetical protein VFS05_10565, partial [Gemmatimonadaceae bacterium]|nr:hypothetical protein [Gemmatimonadaceae bacterium]
PVATRAAVRGIPFTYGISLGVRRGDAARLARLEQVLRRRRADVRAILRSYGVPLVESGAPAPPARSVEGT